MKFVCLCNFAAVSAITLQIFLIILTACNGKKVEVHSSMLLAMCEQRDEFAKSKAIQNPPKVKPTGRKLECGWFRKPTCKASASGCKLYKKCKAGRGTNALPKKRPQPGHEPIVCPAPTPTCPACSGREWAERLDAPLAHGED